MGGLDPGYVPDLPSAESESGEIRRTSNWRSHL